MSDLVESVTPRALIEKLLRILEAARPGEEAKLVIAVKDEVDQWEVLRPNEPVRLIYGLDGKRIG